MATWYWQGAQYEYWGTLTNWTDDYDGDGANPASSPWTTSATKDDDIELGINGNPDSVCQGTLGISGNSWQITGVCSLIGVIFDSAIIYSGTFSGLAVINFGTIFNGTFTGDNFNNSNSIYNGTFTGDNFENFTSIYYGTFSGDTFINSSTIFDGVFNCPIFVNSSLSIIFGGAYNCSTSILNYGYIYRGIFVSAQIIHDSYDINGGIFSSPDFQNFSTIYSGSWWNKGWIKYNGFLLKAYSDANPQPTLFLTNIVTDDILGSGLL